MADNVAITAGAGTTIATDDISGAHYQKVKVFDATADSTNGQTVTSRGGAYVEGPIAHDSPSTANPNRIGLKGVNALPTAVSANNDVVDAIGDFYGQQRTDITHIGIQTPIVHDIVAADAVHTDVELIAAPAAGLCIYVTDIIITNDNTAAMTFKFEEDTGSAKTQRTGTFRIPNPGGLVSNFRTPIKCTAAKNFGFSNTGQSNASITLSYYVAP